MSQEHFPSYNFLQDKLRQDPVGAHIESVLVVVPDCTTFSYSTAYSYLPLSLCSNIFFRHPGCFNPLYDTYKMKMNNSQVDTRNN